MIALFQHYQQIFCPNVSKPASLSIVEIQVRLWCGVIPLSQQVSVLRSMFIWKDWYPNSVIRGKCVLCTHPLRLQSVCSFFPTFLKLQNLLNICVHVVVLHFIGISNTSQSFTWYHTGKEINGIEHHHEILNMNYYMEMEFRKPTPANPSPF